MLKHRLASSLGLLIQQDNSNFTYYTFIFNSRQKTFWNNLNIHPIETKIVKYQASQIPTSNPTSNHSQIFINVYILFSPKNKVRFSVANEYIYPESQFWGKIQITKTKILHAPFLVIVNLMCYFLSLYWPWQKNLLFFLYFSFVGLYSHHCSLIFNFHFCLETGYSLFWQPCLKVSKWMHL